RAEGENASLTVSAVPTASRAPGPAAPLLLNLDCGNPAAFEELIRAAGRKQMHDSRDDTGPAGLMARAEPGPVVPVEGLVEQDQISPVRVLLELPRAPVHGPVPVLAPQEDAAQPTPDLLGDLVQIHLPPRTRRTLDRELIAVEHVVLQQRPDDQRVHGHP